MDEIKLKINSNGIIYDQENAWLREKELRELGADRNPLIVILLFWAITL